MGVEWDIGCMSCRQFIWMGSQKRHGWKGFQLDHQLIKRFMTWHTKPDCTIFLSNDGTRDVPWNKHPEEWEEDCTSRGLDDSWSREGRICAHCGKQMATVAAPLILTDWLQFCDTTCQHAFYDYYLERTDRRIYDSSKDWPDKSRSGWTVACTECRTYYTVESYGFHLEDTYFQLALFLGEHMHNGSGLYKVFHYTEPTETPLPWEHPGTAHEWRNYMNEEY